MLLRNGTNEYVESVRKLARHLETTAKSSKKMCYSEEHCDYFHRNLKFYQSEVIGNVRLFF